MKGHLSESEMDHQYSQLKESGLNLAAEIFKEECEFWRDYTPKRVESKQ